MPPCKIVFIDWHKTLCFDNFWGHWAEPDHPRNTIFHTLQQAFFADSSSLIVPWMRGELTAEEAVRHVASHVSVDEDLLMRELIASCRAMRIIDPEAPALIETLRRVGVRMVLATDNMDTFTRWTAPALGLEELFDDILCSYDLKCLKEDVDAGGNSLFFGPYLAEHGVEPGECVLIDDSRSLEPIAERLGIDFRLVCDATRLVGHLKELTDPEARCPSRRYPAGY
jgi:FMN phosphatase YigB (HAD superfamily)